MAIEMAFSSADTDGTGTMDLAEFTLFCDTLVSHGMALIHDIMRDVGDFTAVFHELAGDDAVISRAEFMAWWTRQKGLAASEGGPEAVTDAALDAAADALLARLGASQAGPPPRALLQRALQRHGATPAPGAHRPPTKPVQPAVRRIGPAPALSRCTNV